MKLRIEHPAHTTVFRKGMRMNETAYLINRKVIMCAMNSIRRSILDHSLRSHESHYVYDTMCMTWYLMLLQGKS
jgi:hypothetical protein